MATLNGAKALGIGDTTGSITVGKRADIILIRGNDINIAPVADIEASVVQSATPANVDTVLVDGRIVKRGGKLVPTTSTRSCATPRPRRCASAPRGRKARAEVKRCVRGRPGCGLRCSGPSGLRHALLLELPALQRMHRRESLARFGLASGSAVAAGLRPGPASPC